MTSQVVLDAVSVNQYITIPYPSIGFAILQIVRTFCVYLYFLHLNYLLQRRLLLIKLWEVTYVTELLLSTCLSSCLLK
jgi:hypothetical protein